LKPLATVLSGLVTPSPSLARAILGYGFYLAAGRKFRDPQDRKDALVKVLDVRSERDVDPGEPGTPDPESPVFPTEFNREILHQMAGLIPEFDADTIRATFIAAMAFKQFTKQDKAKGKEKRKGSQSALGYLEIFKQFADDVVANRLSVFGTVGKEEEDDVVAALAVQAIRSPELSARIQVTDTKRTYLFPDVASSNEVADYVSTEVSNQYKARYETALKNKRFEEEAIKSAQLIETLVKSATIDNFIEVINDPTQTPSITSRSSPGYRGLVRRLLEDEDVSERLMKVWVLILGRNRTGESVWNNGNVLREDLTPYCKLFEQSNARDLWEELKKLQIKFARHVYRSSNIPNRHGHSNELPSWWARGYPTPDAFQVLYLCFGLDIIITDHSLRTDCRTGRVCTVR